MFSRKKRFSSEYTMLSILEYLYNNSQKISVSKFNIVTNTPGIKSQRPDRVNLMMDTLQASGYIKSNKVTNVTLYQITEKGIEEYITWIKNFLEFARTASL
jgi:predicted transcriptional regulator